MFLLFFFRDDCDKKGDRKILGEDSFERKLKYLEPVLAEERDGTATNYHFLHLVPQKKLT